MKFLQIVEVNIWKAVYKSIPKYTVVHVQYLKPIHILIYLFQNK